MEEGFSLHEIITNEKGEVVDFNFLDANAAYERHMGMKLNDCLGKTMLQIMPHADLSQIKKYGKVALTGEPLTFEYYSKSFNKRMRVRTFCPQIGRFAAIFEDISEQKKAEDELKKISQAVDQSPVMTYITDPSGIIEYVNPKVSEITGYSKEELLGNNPRIFSSGEIEKDEYSVLWQTISSGKEWKGEFHNRKKNGEPYWVMAYLSPVFDNMENITHYIAVEEDITHRKEQYNALKIANLRFESLISGMQAGVMVEDHERRVVLDPDCRKRL
jgi:PAS domain S-box-containing protein